MQPRKRGRGDAPVRQRVFALRVQEKDWGYTIHPRAPERAGALGRDAHRPRLGSSGPAPLSLVVVASDAVKPSALHAALLETASRFRTGRDHCGRVSRPVPCRRGRCGNRVSRWLRTGNPLRRLFIRSKAALFFEILHLVHGGPPAGKAGAQGYQRKGMEQAARVDDQQAGSDHPGAQRCELFSCSSHRHHASFQLLDDVPDAT